MRSPFLLVVVAAAVLAAGCGSSESLEDQARDSRAAKPFGLHAFGYENKWALVVGINYSNHPDSGLLLASAERDAVAVYDALVTGYGYQPGETAFLLLGSAEDPASRATKQNIEKHLIRLYEGTRGTSPESNSVLFYFSGHGERFVDRSSTAGDLYPADIKFFGHGGAEPESVLPMRTVSQRIRECNAIHRLMILDCCYSGLLFDAMTPPPRNEERGASPRFTMEVFSAPALVGLTAGRHTEKVPDIGRILEGHSPFTGALLLCLRAERSTPLPSLELCTFIQRKIDEHNASLRDGEKRIQQIPQIGKEPRGGAGDFYFIPSPARKLPEEKPKEAPEKWTADSLAVAFATFPGLTGRYWWFEEVPWMVPEVRREPRHLPEQTVAHRPIDGQMISRDDMLATLDPASLRRTLYETFQRYSRELQARDILRAGVLAIIPRNLRESRFEWESESVKDELLAQIEPLDDPHLLALVQHRLMRPEAEDSYRKALKRYMNEEATPLRNCLYALCCADLGRWQFDQAMWRQASDSFSLARSFAPDDRQAAAFRVSTRLQEIKAERKLARTSRDWGDLNEKMASAFAEAEKAALPQCHWIYPCLHEDRAWLLMEQWRVTEAKQDFERARTLREEAAEIADPRDKLTLQAACFHNEHGLAMAMLFSGEVDEARLAYERVFRSVEQLREHSDAAFRDDDAIVRRLQNTAERLGDLHLLAMHPQPAKALYWYGAALEYGMRLTSGDTKTPQVKVLYKRAIAEFLAGQPQGAVEALNGAASIDLMPEQEAECAVFRRVAEACRRMKTNEKTEVEEARRSLREILNTAIPGKETGKDQTGGAARGYDALTFLMFAWGRLIDSRWPDDPQDAADPDLLGDAALLFRICPERLSDPAALRHFKSYHDTAIEIRTARKEIDAPVDVVRHIWFANRGETPVWPQRESQLLFHFFTGAERAGFAAIYRPDQSPAGVLRRFDLAESEVTVVEAVRQGAKLSLPDSLRDALMALESPPHVVWPLCLEACPYPIPGNSQ